MSSALATSIVGNLTPATLPQIVEVFNHHLQMRITPGGLLALWFRLQEVLYPWYEEIQREALKSAVLHADETGWRVKGRTRWLWCFSSPDLTYYMINRCRGGPALREFFIEEFEGVLVTDFWGAYNAVAAGARQKCLVHLLRELKNVDKYHRPGADWPDFAKKLRRLIGDAVRLWKRDAVPVEEYQSRRARRAWLGQRRAWCLVNKRQGWLGSGCRDSVLASELSVLATCPQRSCVMKQSWMC